MNDITVIVSAHKDRGYLDECIESVLNQKFSGNYDIILSSDGDGSLYSFALKYNLQFTCSIKHNHSLAFNNAVKGSDSRWIKEVHDDDLLKPNCLQDLWDARADGDIVYGNAINVKDGEIILRHFSPPIVSIKTFLPIMSNTVHGGTLLLNRDVFLKVGGFDTNLNYAEEYEFYINLLSKGYKFSYCNKTLVQYRLHPDQQTSYFSNAINRQTKAYIENKYSDYLKSVTT
jgi:glycosyltransferase involved in cell wall biosynthesis